MSNIVIVNGINVFEKLEKQEKLLELYKELAEFWKKKASLTYVPIDDEELERLENRIKELENEQR